MVDSKTFALSTEHNFPDRFFAVSNATIAILSISSVVYDSVLNPLFEPLEISSIPLGSPKYIPLVSSRRINRSSDSITSGFSVEEFTKELKTIAGLKFANKSISFLILSNPRSGLISKLSLSHFSPPTAPSKTASTFFAFCIVSSVIGSPYSSIEAPPIEPRIILKFELVFFVIQSISFTACSDISLPIPSPGRSKTSKSFCFIRLSKEFFL